jgi:hypothetical protein
MASGKCSFIIYDNVIFDIFYDFPRARDGGIPSAERLSARGVVRAQTNRKTRL